MAMNRWDPFREVVSLREAMDRMYEESMMPSRRTQEDGGQRRFRLPVDAYVTPEEIVVIADMAGTRPEDVEITLEGDTLTIRGRKPAPMQNVNYVLLERVYGDFQRTLNINVPIDAEKADAKFDNGVLMLTIPKAEAAKPKTIQVTSKPSQQTLQHQPVEQK